MNHLSKQISAFGRGLVLKQVQHKTGKHNNLPILTTVNEDKEEVLLVVYTKRYMVFEGVEVTGANEYQMQGLEKTINELGLKDAFLVFVDSKYGQVYGAYYSNLQKGASFWGLNFPYIKASHGGRLVLFPVHKMPTLFRIPDKELAELRKMQADNKADKNQTALF